MKQYALYKGDRILAIGTADEIAEELHITKRSVWSYHTPTYSRRTTEKGRRLIELID